MRRAKGAAVVAAVAHHAGDHLGHRWVELTERSGEFLTYLVDDKPWDTMGYGAPLFVGLLHWLYHFCLALAQNFFWTLEIWPTEIGVKWGDGPIGYVWKSSIPPRQKKNGDFQTNPKLLVK